MRPMLFHQQLAALAPETAGPLSTRRQTQRVAILGDGDVHVLAATLECGADYLLTLDRRHLITATLLAAKLLLSVMTPGEFLRQIARSGE